MGNIYKNGRMVDFSNPATLPALQADPAAASALAKRNAILSGFGNALDTILNPQPFRFEMPPMPEPPPTLSYAEAESRARGQLNPLYETELEKTLEAVDQDTIRRGFFGQLPAGALRGARAAEVERAKVAAINALANQLVGQSEEAARAMQQLAQQRWATEAQLRMQAAQNAYQQQDAAKTILSLWQLRQQADEAEKDRQAQLEREKLPWTMGMTPYQQAQVAVSQLKAAKASGTKSGGTKAPTKTDWEAAIMSVSDYYKRPEDYLADLQRYKKELLQLVGPTGYNRLLGSAGKAVEEWDYQTYGSRWVPGQGSPLYDALKRAGAM
ncbi:MAG: hypothetical protein AB1609_00790 [Bacillota bacterium]